MCKAPTALLVHGAESIDGSRVAFISHPDVAAGLLHAALSPL
jgi:hypothetical protein